MRIHLYFSIPEYFPTTRLDVAELFGVSLQKMGLATEWFMVNSEQNRPPGSHSYFNQKCVVPYKVKGRNLLSKILTKLFYWVTDTTLILVAAFGSFDIIQTRDKYIVSVIAVCVAKLSGKPFVYWCSYPFPEHAMELANRKRGLGKALLLMYAKFVKLLLYQFVMKHADHTFVQTERMRQDIVRYGVPKNRMTPVPMGVPERLLGWVKSNKIEVVQGRVVYIGTLDSVRNLHVLIDAFSIVSKSIPISTLLIVGDGVKPEDRIRLEQQVSNLGLSQKVTFTGFIPIEQAWSIAASASVCVSPIYPSPILNCGSPTKLYEYMALGRPVVCNHHPEQTIAMNESDAGLCVEWGAEKFADAIIWMLEHSDQAEAMGMKGPAWVAANRTYPILADIVWQKYQEILGNKA